MPTLASNEFLDTVRKSGLVADDVLDKAAEGDLVSDPDEVAQRLVQSGALTSFQAKQLLAGKHRGLTLGPYKILDQIGRGGMGVVYLAEHLKLLRQVALKILPKEHMADKLALDRFYREARAVAALDHPNIVKAHDVNEDQGVHYFVMEYVQGVNLQQYLDQKGPVPWKKAVWYVVQACWGLQHAHKKGMVHRDIKPGNLLVDKKGTLKILDLGLARCFDKASDNLTENLSDGNQITGSVNYISPEQAIGSKDVDIRADIYSLGATLFALVAGRPPFEGSPAQKLLQHQVKDPPALHDVCAGVPRELSAVLARMMAKKPEARYATPAEVVIALEPWMGTSVAGRVGSNAGSGDSSARSQRIVTPVPVADWETGRHTVAARDESTQVDLRLGEEDEQSLKKKQKKLAKQRREQQERRRRLLYAASAVLFTAPLLLGGAWLFFRQTSPRADAAAETPPTAKTPPELALAPPPAASKPAPQFKPGLPPPSHAPNPTSPPPPTQQAGPSAAPAPTEPPQNNTPRGPIVGQGAPDIDGVDLNGEQFTLTDYRGQVVLLDFWNSTNETSRRYYSYKRALVQRHFGRPFSLLGVNNDTDEQKLKSELARYSITWRSFRNERGTTGAISKTWHVTSWPTLFLIDHKGVVRKRWSGTFDSEEVERLLSQLLVVAELDKSKAQ